jgi:hypothetical protein
MLKCRAHSFTTSCWLSLSSGRSIATHLRHRVTRWWCRRQSVSQPHQQTTDLLVSQGERARARGMCVDHKLVTNATDQQVGEAGGGRMKCAGGAEYESVSVCHGVAFRQGIARLIP